MVPANEISIPSSPLSLGLNSKYKNWRHFQEKAVREVIDTNGFLGQVQPTGSGKSLTYISSAILLKAKTVILTSTKALQQQLMSDFGNKLKLIMGQNNYVCTLDDSINCDSGICHLGIKCQFKESGCPYFDAVTEANEADIVVTNYNYWLLAGSGSKVDLLVLDEAHHAPSIVTDFMTIEYNHKDISKLFQTEVPYHGNDVDEWVLTGKHFLGLAKLLKDKAKIALDSNPNDKHFRELGRSALIAEKLFTAMSHMDGRWIAERSGADVRLFPIQTSRFVCESALFKGVKKILLTSATLSRKTMQMLHIDNYTFTEYPSVFPIKNRRVYHVKTCMMNFRTSRDTLYKRWLPRINKIIEVYGSDVKGIIHTGSYERQKFIVENSPYKSIMFYNTSHTTRHIVDRFKKANPPAVLVSPSVTAGFDFPYEQCRYQIIGKLPFPDTRGEVWRIRKQMDPELIDYMTAQTLVQQSGRGTRAGDDFCRTFIVDDSIAWWWPNRGRKYAPKWFDESLSIYSVVPELNIPEVDLQTELSPMQLYKLRKEGKIA